MAEFKLFVGNLPPGTTQDHLAALFEYYGRLIEAVLLPPKASQSDQRCGFVKFGTPHEAEAALAGTNGLEYGGSNLLVRHAVPRAPQAALPAPPYNPSPGYPAPRGRGYGQPSAATAPPGKLFVGNIPSTWTDGSLTSLFAPYGTLGEVVILARRGINDTQCGFVKFLDPHAAAYAVQTLNGTDVEGMELVVRHAEKGAGRPMQGAPTRSFQAGPMRTFRGGHVRPYGYRPY